MPDFINPELSALAGVFGNGFPVLAAHGHPEYLVAGVQAGMIACMGTTAAAATGTMLMCVLVLMFVPLPATPTATTPASAPTTPVPAAWLTRSVSIVRAVIVTVAAATTTGRHSSGAQPAALELGHRMRDRARVGPIHLDTMPDQPQSTLIYTAAQHGVHPDLLIVALLAQ